MAILFRPQRVNEHHYLYPNKNSLLTRQWIPPIFTPSRRQSYNLPTNKAGNYHMTEKAKPGNKEIVYI